VEDFGKFLDDQHNRFPKRPLIVSEYGANGDLRLHSEEPRRFDSTIEYQRFFHESYLAQIQARPYLAGSAIWSEFDFGSEFRGDTIPHLNQKGMFTSARIPKDINFFYKAQFSTANMVHIAVRDTPKLASRKSTEQSITVYSNLPEVELFRDGVSLGKKTFDNMRKQSWVVPLKPGINSLTARGGTRNRNVVDSAPVAFEFVTIRSDDIAVNVGSNADFLDETGKVWLSDQPYAKGSWGYRGSKTKRVYSSTEDRNILNTNSEPLFQTMVEGLDEYKFDLPDGNYEVELLFAETRFSAPGKRVFDVLVNGTKILSALDLAGTVGRDHVFRKQVNIDAEDGISIRFAGLIGDPVLSGVRIRRRK
jgi:beta-galactosidase